MTRAIRARATRTRATDRRRRVFDQAAFGAARDRHLRDAATPRLQADAPRPRPPPPAARRTHDPSAFAPPPSHGSHQGRCHARDTRRGWREPVVDRARRSSPSPSGDGQDHRVVVGNRHARSHDTTPRIACTQTAGDSCYAVVRFSPTEGFVGWQAVGSLTATATDPGTDILVDELSIPVLGRAVL